MASGATAGQPGQIPSTAR